MSNGRLRPTSRLARRLAGVSVAALVATVAFAPVGSADPDAPDPSNESAAKPTIAEVQEQLGELNHQGEIAAEKLNEARVEVQQAEQRLETLEADVDRQRLRVERLRSRVVGSAVDRYQSASSMSPATAFFTADDAGQLLSGMATSALVETQQAGLLVRLTQQQKQLGVREEQAQVVVDALSDKKADTVEHQEELDAKITEAEELLGELEEEERQRVLALQETAPHPDVNGDQPDVETTSREQPRVNITDAPASERAQIAVQTALDQVGDPYVYGAAGPDSFDCSGLTMFAWAAAGVSIPHASSMQPSSGTPVSMSSLQPGDLIFFYSPISHVGMYIGNGQIVHAPHSGSYVQVVPVSYMPASMAVRIA